MTRPQIGDPAPDFTLEGDAGPISLGDFAGRKLALYFYPKDDTPGCTNQARDFSGAIADFAAAGAGVVGVSRDSVAAHARFRAKHNLAIDLGADEAGTVTEAFGVWVEKAMYGLTMPLVTKSDGTKFGKTEAGAIWLDPEKLSPYKFYQFWLNTDDKDVVKFLKYFTFLSISEINELAEGVEKEPEKRSAQRALAIEVTKLVHGQDALERAQKISSALFGGGLRNLSAAEIEEGFSDVPSATIDNPETGLVDLLIQGGVVSSKRQAREAIASGAIYINDIRHTEVETIVPQLDRLDGKYLVIRRGKKNYYLIKFNV